MKGKRVQATKTGELGTVTKVCGNCLWVAMDAGHELSGARQYFRLVRSAARRNAEDREFRQGVHAQQARGIRLMVPNCQHPGCIVRAVAQCESGTDCDRWFCAGHGTKGGDRQVQDVGAAAYPSQCWAHGGFNADEDDSPIC